MKVIYLPNQFKIQEIDEFTRMVVDPKGEPVSNRVLFDFKNLRFIDGTGFTVLRNSIAWLASRRVTVKFDNFRQPTNEAIVYLDDCGFFKHYTGRPVRTYLRNRSTTLPCQFIERDNSFSFLEHQFSAWMSATLDMHHVRLGGLRTCMKEIFNNIYDHSTKTTGFVHVQHYPTLERINITTSDFGVGIPRTIRSQYGNMSDARAIEWAATEGVTAQSRKNNMGAGLNYVLDYITSEHGRVVIHSYGGFLSAYNYHGDQRRKATNGAGRYPGTLIDISIDTSAFRGDDQEKPPSEIEW